MSVLNDFVAGLKFGDTQTYGRLTIRPVIAEGDVSLPFLTLEEAQAKDLLEITETSEDGSVPELLVKNTGDTDVILIEGEILEGAKQNRMVNTTIIVPAKTEMTIPVTCVERGRWHYKRRNFRSAGHVAYSSMRRASHQSVAKSVLRFDRHTSDQGAVWSDIEAKMARLRIHSASEAATDMEDHIMRSVASTYEKPIEEGIVHQPNQVGFIAFIDNGFAGADLFGSADLCERQLIKLARGYLVDSEDPAVKFPEIDGDEVLRGLAESEPVERKSVGKGREFRFESVKIEGACKVVDERVSHITVFPK